MKEITGTLQKWDYCCHSDDRGVDYSGFVLYLTGVDEGYVINNENSQTGKFFEIVKDKLMGEKISFKCDSYDDKVRFSKKFMTSII